MRSATIPTLPFGLILGMPAIVGIALTSTDVFGDVTVNVTATIEEECVLQTSNVLIDFGNYEDNPITKSGQFTYTCPSGKTLTFSLPLADNGNFRSLPNVTNGSSPALQYMIINPESSVWLADYTKASVGTGETLTFEATMPSGQIANGVLPGTYEDQLILTMTVGP